MKTDTWYETWCMGHRAGTLCATYRERKGKLIFGAFCFGIGILFGIVFATWVLYY